MTALGIVPDAVASAQTDPLRDGPVLLLLLGHNALNLESLLRRLYRRAGQRRDVSTPFTTSAHAAAFARQREPFAEWRSNIDRETSPRE